MATEDKLSGNERLRLEALAQAIAWRVGMQHSASADGVIQTAGKFEQYIKHGEVT